MASSSPGLYVVGIVMFSLCFAPASGSDHTCLEGTPLIEDVPSSGGCNACSVNYIGLNASEVPDLEENMVGAQACKHLNDLPEFEGQDEFKCRYKDYYPRSGYYASDCIRCYINPDESLFPDFYDGTGSYSSKYSVCCSNDVGCGLSYWAIALLSISIIMCCCIGCCVLVRRHIKRDSLHGLYNDRLLSYEDFFNAPVVLAEPLAPGESPARSHGNETSRSGIFKWFATGRGVGLSNVPVLETREEQAVPIGEGRAGDEYFETYVYDERTGTEVAVAGIELVQYGENQDASADSANDNRDDLDALDCESDDEGSIHGIHYGELVDAVELEHVNAQMEQESVNAQNE